MSRCSCGYRTRCRDEFCAHLVSNWDDLRIDHGLNKLN